MNRATDAELAAALITWRRELHRHPETGWTEFWTTAFAADVLHSLGYAPRVGREILNPDQRMGLPAPAVLERARQRAVQEGADPRWLERMGPATGIVADLHPGREPDLVLRFDLDALEMPEADDAGHLPAREGFASRHPGLCHACGHDGHTALGLGLAALLRRDATRLARNVRLLFQPAEEGVRGASALIQQVLGARRFLAVHLGLSAPESGSLVTGLSGFLATTKFDARFTGRAAHAGLAPEAGRDALQGAAEALLALHALPDQTDQSGQEGQAKQKGRINVGLLAGGSARNIVPDQAVMACETRCVDRKADNALLAGARAALRRIARERELGLEITIQGRAGCANSNAELAQLLARTALELPPGPDGQPLFAAGKICSEGRMTASEDAATLMEAVRLGGGQAAYALLGADLAGGHHTPHFDFDESVLWPGALWLAAVCGRLCG
ncbi:amidohydrolase [Desulfovibrio sp. 3_1_syn3]|uniref:amidohydrolase n=1 Tax=Desulfovibrio sp. 3_1_syn3 TaxID=457398 RepID=UPI0001E12933|nr:amidohydrolase [Desulfovibrio sp. 3_1_syn3]EFL87132.1 amidohydrolase [Desulfovibrio sp. 3_1_syn3]